MKTYQRQLLPQDVLFLRDARPMEASDAGCGANWPRPDQLWNALIHQMHRLWPQRQTWEGAAHSKREEELDSTRHSSDRFGALQTVGPFPLKDGTVYFPCPLDLGVAEDGSLLSMQVVSGAGTDLPKPLTLAFSTPVLGKQSLPAWISHAEYLQYLAGKPFHLEKTPLYDVERNIGIAIDSETGATISGQIYQAEYLRLRDGVGLAFLASCEIKPKGGSGLVDVLEKISLPEPLIIGGQQGIANMLPAEWKLPGIQVQTAPGQPLLLRWTLLSPATPVAGCPIGSIQILAMSCCQNRRRTACAAPENRETPGGNAAETREVSTQNWLPHELANHCCSPDGTCIRKRKRRGNRLPKVPKRRRLQSPPDQHMSLSAKISLPSKNCGRHSMQRGRTAGSPAARPISAKKVSVLACAVFFQPNKSKQENDHESESNVHLYPYPHACRSRLLRRRSRSTNYQRTTYRIPGYPGFQPQRSPRHTVGR